MPAAVLAAGMAMAQAPLKHIDSHADFDPAALSRENFYQVLPPLARKEGKLVFYNFAGGFDSIWKTALIPQFEARYGVKVEYRNVRKDQANQQLLAVHRAGMASPADVYFAGGPENYEILRAGGVIAALDLASLLPNLAAVPDRYKRVAFGVDTHGAWPLVHLSQMALVYDGALLQEREVPRDFAALLSWARKYPKRLAITSPLKGGSGAAFLYSAALHLAQDANCQTALRNTRMTEDEATRWAAEAACLAPLWNYLASLMEVSELTNGNADTLNLLNNRQAWLGTAWEDHVNTMVSAHQLPSTMRLTLLAPGFAASGDGLMMPANARSPAAALLFIDMAFGLEFQRWKFEQRASRSPRADLDQASPPAALTLVPQVQMKTWSIPINWRAAHGLARAFEDRVLFR